jgi:hypothetical protein
MVYACSWIVDGRGAVSIGGRSYCASLIAWLHAHAIQPGVDLIDVEAKQTPPFVEWDTPFADQPTHVANGDTEVFGEIFDTDEAAES